MRRHLTNASYLFAADAASRALNFVAVAWLARTLAPELYGLVVIAASMLDYALLLCDWGVKTLGARETAMPAETRRHAPSDIARARAVLSLAVFAVANAAVALLPLDPHLRTLAHLFLLGVLPYSFLLDWYHQGRGSFGALTLGRATGSAVLLLGVVTLVHSPAHVDRVPWIYVASLTATSLVMLATVPRLRAALGRGRGGTGSVGSVLRGSSALGVAALFGQSFVVLPPIVVGHFEGAAPAGHFYAAMRIVAILLVVDRIFGALYLPALSRLWQVDRARAQERLVSTFRVVVAAGAGVATVCIAVASDLVRIVFGAGYAGADDILRLLAPFVPLTLINTFLAYGLVAIGEERTYLRMGVASGLVFIVLLVVATATLGVHAAAIAIVVGELLMAVLLYAEFARHAPLRVARPLVASLAVGAAVVLIATAVDTPRVWHAPLYAGGFLGGVMLLGGLGMNDLKVEAR
jgi:PST family polysaccharide transporter